jgi:hypothetical protein
MHNHLGLLLIATSLEASGDAIVRIGLTTAGIPMRVFNPADSRRRIVHPHRRRDHHAMGEVTAPSSAAKGLTA